MTTDQNTNISSTDDSVMATYEQCVSVLAQHPPYIGLTFALACRSGDRPGQIKTRALCLEALEQVEDLSVASTIRKGIRSAMLWTDDGRRARCIEKISLDLLPLEERAAYYGRVHDVQEAMTNDMSAGEAARSIA